MNYEGEGKENMSCVLTCGRCFLLTDQKKWIKDGVKYKTGELDDRGWLLYSRGIEREKVTLYSVYVPGLPLDKHATVERKC